MHRFFFPAGAEALSPGDRFRLRASRILAVATLVLLLPLSSRWFGFAVDVPTRFETVHARPGERVWMSRDIAGVGAGDLVLFDDITRLNVLGEVVAIEGGAAPARVVRIRSGVRELRIPESEIHGRGVLVYSPLYRFRRLSRHSEGPSS